MGIPWDIRLSLYNHAAQCHTNLSSSLHNPRVLSSHHAPALRLPPTFPSFNFTINKSQTTTTSSSHSTYWLSFAVSFSRRCSSRPSSVANRRPAGVRPAAWPCRRPGEPNSRGLVASAVAAGPLVGLQRFRSERYTRKNTVFCACGGLDVVVPRSPVTVLHGGGCNFRPRGAHLEPIVDGTQRQLASGCNGCYQN